MSPQMVQVLGAAATLYGLGGALSVLLQARRMHVRGTSDDVSARFFAVYVGGFAIWLLYGLGIGDVPIILVHAVGLLCGTVTLAVTLKLRRPDAPFATMPSGREDRARRDRPLLREPRHGAASAGNRRGNRMLPATAPATGTVRLPRRRSYPGPGTVRSYRDYAVSPTRPQERKSRVRTRRRSHLRGRYPFAPGAQVTNASPTPSLAAQGHGYQRVRGARERC